MRVDNSFKKLYLGKEEREGAITTAAHRVDEGVFIPMCNTSACFRIMRRNQWTRKDRQLSRIINS